MEIISRAEAGALGLKRYFTGKTCKHGHICERYVSSSVCVECMVAASAHSFRKNRAVVMARHVEWKATTPRAAMYQNLRARLTKFPTSNPVTVDDLMELWNRQQGRCALSGLSMVWSGSEGSNGCARSLSLSIDRIDQRIGYELNNIRLICNCFNSFRGSGTDEEMLDAAEALLAFQRAKLAAE
jgi:hypothetical protein